MMVRRKDKKQTKARQQTQRQFGFTVIAGDLKGRKITAPDLGITRPPLSRLRKSIFDFLSPYIEGASYLDLFSGTGSYLFEATSRGASTATGVELEPRLADQINGQAVKFGVDDRLKCLCGDVFEMISHLAGQGKKFNIIMLAPPQYRGFLNRAMSLLAESNLLEDEGMILLQHDTSETDDIDTIGFELIQRRKYGNTTFTILTGA